MSTDSQPPAPPVEIPPVEIPLRHRYRVVTNSSQASRGSGNSGTSKSRPVMLKGEKEAAMAATRENQMVLILVGGTHKRFVRASSLG